jgi:hopanoid biosynthesis associated protein HpnK
MKRLIITADDFGLSSAVNEAVEEAHRNGVLSTTSLMVGAKETGDAIDRARRIPSLRVGLHLVLVAGSPVLPAHTLPDLVDGRGEFSSHLVRAGINFFFGPGARRQLEQEIRAQFQAFQDTGLLLDHVNCHHHMHLHPTLGELILRVGREYGLKAMRFPYEPLLPSWRASRKNFDQKLLSWLALSPWLVHLKNLLRHAQVRSNHFLFGLNDSGNMNLDLVLRFLRHLPTGVTEIYFHPVSRAGSDLGRTAGAGEEDLSALTSPDLRKALSAPDIQSIGFSDL